MRHLQTEYHRLVNIPACVLVSLAGFGAVVFLSASTITPGIVQVDFTKPIQTVSPLAFSIDESGYGMGGKQILTRDAVFAQKIRTLKPAMVRMHLRYNKPSGNDRKIMCGGSGCATDETGERWVSSIKALGAIPVVSIDNDASHPLKQDVESSRQLVIYFNKTTKNPVKRWIIGNEPDNAKMDAVTYGNRFNAIYDAMKAVDPSIQIGGPANAYFNQAFLKTFLIRSGSRVDFLDFHQYGQGGDTQLDETTLLSKTVEYRRNIQTLRQLVQSTPQSAARANKIAIEVGEWNLDWSGNTKQYQPFATVWGASALGQIIQAGGIGMAYAGKNGDLGLLWEKQTNKSLPGFRINDAMPMYHAIGMYTGEGLFPAFGKRLVKASVSSSDIEVYASDSPKSILLINKNPRKTQTLRFTLVGAANGKASVWQKSATMPVSAPPKKVAEVTVLGQQFIYAAPTYSVSRIILQP